MIENKYRKDKEKDRDVIKSINVYAFHSKITQLVFASPQNRDVNRKKKIN